MSKATFVTPIQPHPSPILRRTSNPQSLLPRPRIAALHPLKPLHQPTNHVRSQIERKLLSNANPRPSIERQKRPPRPQIPFDPALRHKLVRILAVHVFPAVHGKDLIAHLRAFWHEDWRRAICSAADGECGVSQGFARITRYRWVEAEGSKW